MIDNLANTKKDDNNLIKKNEEEVYKSLSFCNFEDWLPELI